MTFFRKIRIIFFTIVASPLVIVIRLLRPFILIRVGPLRSERLGHFAAETELCLCERDAGIYGRRILDIFYYNNRPICNRQLKKMWDRKLLILNFAKYLDRVNRLIPRSKKHIPRPLSADRDKLGLLYLSKPHISFTQEEERKGELKLRELGLKENDLFICFLSRDSVYLDKLLPETQWRYHDYRNSNISNFLLAAEELTRRGYFMFRMGVFVKETIQNSNPKIIDYASNFRDEFLDIFLGAKCHFYLGDSCGFHAIPMIFRRPLAIVNMIPFEYAPTWSPDYLFIPKKLWLRSQKRFLTFREMLGSSGVKMEGKRYEEMGVDILENTPEEILALAVEMEERLKGIRQYTDEDEALQCRFRSILEKSSIHGRIMGRLGAEFLRQNISLLG